MQRYSNNSLMSKFIKNLLYHVYIPTCDTVSIGDFIIKDFDYVYETNVIKCTQTGYLGGKFHQDIEYGTVYGKNRLYNRLLASTTQQPFVYMYESESDIDYDGIPFAVLNIPERKLTVNYSLYKFNGTETYTTGSTPNQLILQNPGFTVKSNYTGLDDSKCFCNALTKETSSATLKYTTITLFENNNNIYFNSYTSLKGVTDIDSFKQWTVDNNLYYSYPLEIPHVINNLTDDDLRLLFDGLQEGNNVIVYNYPIYNMIFKLEEVYPVEYVIPKGEKVSRSVNNTVNGIRYTVHPDGSISINGTATADSYFTFDSNFNSTELVGYIFNGLDENSSATVEIRITNSDYTTIYQTINENNEEIFNSGTSCSFSIFIPQGQSVSNYLMYPMIRKSTEATDSYVRYEEPYYGIVSIKETMVDVAQYVVLNSFEWGTIYNKYSQNYITDSNYYDNNLHSYFGKFLRCFRDVKGIDLMPYFNLYNNDYLSNYSIDYDGVEHYYNNTYKILKVPIRFNKKYTIAIDCSSEVWICPAFFIKDNPVIIKSSSGLQDLDLSTRLNEYGKYSKNYNSLSFRNPILYEVKNTSTNSTYKESMEDCAYFQQYERDLVLLIQLPISNNSSVVILEGDYTDTQSTKVLSNDQLWKLHETELNKVLCSNLSLLQFSTKENYVYSDRIIEYLLWNVITSQDTVSENVEYVQNLSPVLSPDNYTFGVWNNYMRSKLFNFSLTQKNSNKLDMNGFVDKDTEKLLIHQVFN